MSDLQIGLAVGCLVDRTAHTLAVTVFNWSAPLSDGQAPQNLDLRALTAPISSKIEMFDSRASPRAVGGP